MPPGRRHGWLRIIEKSAKVGWRRRSYSSTSARHPCLQPFPRSTWGMTKRGKHSPGYFKHALLRKGADREVLKRCKQPPRPSHTSTASVGTHLNVPPQPVMLASRSAVSTSGASRVAPAAPPPRGGAAMTARSQAGVVTPVPPLAGSVRRRIAVRQLEAVLEACLVAPLAYPTPFLSLPCRRTHLNAP